MFPVIKNPNINSIKHFFLFSIFISFFSCKVFKILISAKNFSDFSVKSQCLPVGTNKRKLQRNYNTPHYMFYHHLQLFGVSEQLNLRLSTNFYWTLVKSCI